MTFSVVYIVKIDKEVRTFQFAERGVQTVCVECCNEIVKDCLFCFFGDTFCGRLYLCLFPNILYQSVNIRLDEIAKSGLADVFLDRVGVSVFECIETVDDGNCQIFFVVLQALREVLDVLPLFVREFGRKAQLV